LKPLREKKQITYKGKPIKITADFSTETWKAKRAWSEIFQALNENNSSPRILYPAKLSFKINGEIKIFHDKQKLKAIYDHQATTTVDSARNSAGRIWKQRKPREDGKHQTQEKKRQVIKE
jgi:hypothetical protein